jgi:calcium-dependent protein kinase
MKKVNGTPYYIAPEVLNEVYDEKCDVWSCGVILYMLLCGYPPFNGDNEDEILKAVKKGSYDFPEEEWSVVSKEARELVYNMLKFEPKKRYSAKECLSHIWVKNNQEITSDTKISLGALDKLKKFKVKFFNFLT